MSTACGWRVWLAFEVRPGIMPPLARDMPMRAILESCRGPDGKTDVADYMHWVELLLDYSHAWGDA